MARAAPESASAGEEKNFSSSCSNSRSTPLALFVLGGTLKFRRVGANLRYLAPSLLFKLMALPAANFSAIDGELHRILRLPDDPPRDAYPAIRARVLARHAHLPAGTRFSFPDKHPGEDYWIDFLRPDILADVPDSPDKGF